jgi:hypothetical protein
MMTLNEFNDKFSGTLNIELFLESSLTEDDGSKATITATKFEPYVIDDNDDINEQATTEYLDEVVIELPKITVMGESKEPIEHVAPNCKHFTVRALFAVIEQTEQQTRGDTDWFGGIDIHHVYFEGLHEEQEGLYRIYWGS